MLRYIPLIALIAAPSLAIGGPPNDPAFYDAKNAYEVKGTVTETDDDDITLRREGLPRIELEVSNSHTKITLDGKEAKLRDLSPGTEVRASFQIDGDDIVAITLEGKSGGGSKK